MSRLCRLKSRSHGEDGKWAHDEIVRLRKQRDELLVALEQFVAWGRMQHKAQSKGCHATFDMMSLKDEIDLAEATIASVKTSCVSQPTEHETQQGLTPLCDTQESVKGGAVKCQSCLGTGKCIKPAIIPEPPDVQCPVCRGTGKGGAA